MFLGRERFDRERVLVDPETMDESPQSIQVIKLTWSNQEWQKRSTDGYATNRVCKVNGLIFLENSPRTEMKRIGKETR